MPRRIHDDSGATWEVSASGRRTQYNRDELTVEFLRVEGGPREQRYARFSPRGATASDLALEAVSDHTLGMLLRSAQPSWTSPDAGYTRSG